MMKNRIPSLIMLVLMFVFLASNNVRAETNMPTLRFGVAEEYSSRLEKVLYVALKNIGYNLAISAQGMTQAMETTNSGEKDGFIGQMPGAEKSYTNIVMVPIPIETATFEAYSRSDSNFELKSWADFSGLRVGTVFQKPYIDAHLPESVKSITKKNSVLELLTALHNNEFDVAVFNQIATDEKYSLKNIKFVNTIDSVPGYIYLNGRRRELIPALSKELSKMKESGLIESILRNETEVQESKKQRYIHLTSYSYDSAWNMDFYNGLKPQLKDGVVDIDTISLYSEFTVNDKIRLNNIANLLRSELLDKTPNAIIVSDDEALKFLKQYYFLLFPKVPVIFCGIQNFTPDKIDGFEKYFSGISEQISVEDTLATMLKMFPKTKNIFVINDYTKLGVDAKNEIQSKVSSLKLDTAFSYNTSTGQALLNEIKNLNKDTVILVGKYESENNQKEAETSFSYASNVPIFGLYATSFGYGQLGGKYVDSFVQGEAVGKILKMLPSNQTSAKSNIIMDVDANNTWKFDYTVLKKFKLENFKLPDGAYVANLPVTPRKLHSKEMLIFVALALTAASVVVLLLFFLRSLNAKNKLLNETMTKLHTAEEMLQKDIEIAEAKVRLEKTLDSSPASLLICSNGICTGYNKKASETFTLKINESIVSMYANIEERKSMLELISTQGYLHGAVKHHYIKDGSIRRFHCSASSDKSSGEEELYVWILDIEEIELKKDLIIKSRQDSLKVLNSIPISLAVISRDRKREFVNDAYIKMFEFTSYEEAINFDVSKLYPPTQPNGQNSTEYGDYTANKSVEHGISATFNWHYFSKNKRAIETISHTRGITYHGKNSAMLVLRDVREEKQKAEQLYLIAQEEKAANQLKNKFLINMSHEIRTPMNAIVGLTEIELRRSKNKEILDVLKKINLSAKNLLSIIGDILDFSKIEAEELMLNEEELDLEEVIANVLLMANQRIGSKNISLVLNMDTNLPSSLISDKTRLWQILKNLLDNSAKYTREGKIQLDVFSTDATPSVLTNICFKVTDTGFGMSKEQMSKLFMPFEQFHNNLLGQPSGTGLGMVITKQMVELMQGSISVESKQNEGTCFTVIIPFKIPEVVKTIQKTISDLPLAKHNILVADDDPFTLEIIKDLVETTGASPVCATSGEDAVRLYEQHLKNGSPFDIVILDYIMPEMNGVQAAQAIKSMSEHKLAKLLMVSSYTKQLILSEIQAVGYEDVIEKPFTPFDFMRRLGEIADARLKLNNFDDIIFPGARVLLCEDNLINQEVAIGVLEYFSIIPTIANNGQEALELLENQQFDLIFMDILMPLMDGHQATQIIRASDKPYKDIPIIAMTANVMADEIEKCMREGMNGHIGKPISFERIFATLNEFLKKYSGSKNSAEEVELHSGLDGLRKKGGFAVDEALARLRNNEQRYIKMLKSFSGSLSDYIMPLEEALKPENERQVSINIHTLKGVAGNLGLKLLQEASAEYEKSKSSQQYETLVKLAIQTADDISAML